MQPTLPTQIFKPSCT